VIASALAVVALLAAACGSANDSLSAAHGGAGLGDSQVVAGSSLKLEVWLDETRRLPAEEAGGTQVRPALFGTKLTIRNVGGRFYDDAISLCAVLTDTSGRTHNVAWEIVDERAEGFGDVLEGVRIPAGGSRSGWVYFALAPDQRPATLRFTPEAGFGRETGVWSLE